MNSLQRRKSKSTLILRIVCLVSVSLFYLCVQLLSTTDTKSQLSDNVDRFSQRKMLIYPNDDDVDSDGDVSESIDENMLKNIKPILIINCTEPSILDFPSDGFSKRQRQHGWIIFHLILACYCFWLLAIICDDYFVPTIKLMCKRLKMREDVAGATLMAAATSSPELFINCVGTFVTEGDIGVGTIVGSAVFNILAVPACCGLLGGQVFNLDWYPVSRDCLMYGISVLTLLGVLHDEKIMWYEALVLVLLYIFYIVSMYGNDWMSRNVKRFVSNLKQNSSSYHYKEVTEITSLLPKLKTINNVEDVESNNNMDDSSDQDEDMEIIPSPWMKGEKNTIGFALRWPITFVLWASIPNTQKYPKLRFLSFFVCIIWIGMASYSTAFVITVIGDTLNIPDSVVGLTFLAAGTSVPEAVSSVIVTRQGFGEMGISNSIGSNTFDILLCLGLPWLFKSLLVPVSPGNLWVTINSSGLTYSVVLLLTTLIGLYVAFALNKFRMDYKIGLVCTIMYISFLIIATLTELNIFFPVNLPTCKH